MKPHSLQRCQEHPLPFFVPGSLQQLGRCVSRTIRPLIARPSTLPLVTLLMGRGGRTRSQEDQGTWVWYVTGA